MVILIEFVCVLFLVVTLFLSSRSASRYKCSNSSHGPIYSLRTLLLCIGAICATLASLIHTGEDQYLWSPFQSLLVVSLAIVLTSFVLLGAIRSRCYRHAFCIGSLLPIAAAFGITLAVIFPVSTTNEYLHRWPHVVFGSLCQFRHIIGVLWALGLVSGLTSVFFHYQWHRRDRRIR